jgi:AcrR family transcriptional regulator
MVRTVKDYDERYTEFLNVAQVLFFTKGYEPTSVQAIIRGVGVAKGTFYHYFDSKQDILEAIIKRMVEQVQDVLQAIAIDASLTPVQKLEQFFKQSNQWKIDRKEALLQTAQVLYKDENVLLLEKLKEQSQITYVPIFADILGEGMADGTFDIVHPIEIAELIWLMPQAMGKLLTQVMLLDDHREETMAKVQREIETLNTSIERILGMPKDTLMLFDMQDVMNWFGATEKEA